MSHPLATMVRLFVPLLVLAPFGLWKLGEIALWVIGRLAG